MIAALVLAAAGFVYSAQADPFTDEVTHVAQFGSDRGALLAVMCGADTNGEMAVAVSTGRPMYRPDIPMVGRYRERVRFDDEPATEYRFYYNGEAAVLNGAEAMRFVSSMKSAGAVLVEVEDYRGDKVQVNVPMEGAADSIGKVEAACPK